MWHRQGKTLPWRPENKKCFRAKGFRPVDRDFFNCQHLLRGRNYGVYVLKTYQGLQNQVSPGASVASRQVYDNRGLSLWPEEHLPLTENMLFQMIKAQDYLNKAHVFLPPPTHNVHNLYFWSWHKWLQEFLGPMTLTDLPKSHTGGLDGCK